MFRAAPAPQVSEDHVPSRRDEYDRVRAAGARVMTGSQLAGRAAWHDSWEEDVLGCDDDEKARLFMKDSGLPGCTL
eukprot:2230548-Prymnesium_polylepis.2